MVGLIAVIIVGYMIVGRRVKVSAMVGIIVIIAGIIVDCMSSEHRACAIGSSLILCHRRIETAAPMHFLVRPLQFATLHERLDTRASRLLICI